MNGILKYQMLPAVGPVLAGGRRASRWWKILIAVSAVALLTVLAAWAYTEAKPPISLSVVSYTTYQFGDGSTHYNATIVVTNSSRQAFTYFGREPRSVDYTLFRPTRFGWDRLPVPTSGPLFVKRLLLPGESYTFEAGVGNEMPYKVGFEYWDGRSTVNPVWKKLPSWLSRRLPWASQWKTATTGVIDLRAAK